MSPQSPILFLDTGSPMASAALGAGGALLAHRALEQRRTSELLLNSIEEMLTETGLALSDLSGIVALQGPGSFTGLRIGLATAHGLHQSLAIQATALPTHEVLGAATSEKYPAGREVLAVVDATRGEWVAQRFRLVARDGRIRATSLAEPTLLATRSLFEGELRPLVGFGTEALRSLDGLRDAAIELQEPPPLAAVAARHLSADGIDWRPESLSSPIYFRPPAVTLPTTKAGAMIAES